MGWPSWNRRFPRQTGAGLRQSTWHVTCVGVGEFIMSRRARLTVLELGASGLTYNPYFCRSADDWVVVAQQSDEPNRAFDERVRERARRLRREDARIETIEVYAGTEREVGASAARRAALEELASQLAPGGSMLLWPAAGRTPGDADEFAIVGDARRFPSAPS